MDDPQGKNFTAYQRFCVDQIQLYKRLPLTLRSPQVLAGLISHLKTNFQVAKSALQIDEIRKLCGNSAGNEELNGALELAARLWLMIGIEISSRVAISGLNSFESTTSWTDSQSLKSAFLSSFPRFCPNLNTNRVTFDESLNGYELGIVSGIEIVWTANLLRHLSIENKRLYVFAHIPSLHVMRASHTE